METVVVVIPTYPTFLWITGCKILFIVSDQIWKTSRPVAQHAKRSDKLAYKSLDCSFFPEHDKLLPCGGKLLSIF